MFDARFITQLFDGMDKGEDVRRTNDIGDNEDDEDENQYAKDALAARLQTVDLLRLRREKSVAWASPVDK